MANGTHFLEDGFGPPVGCDSLLEEIGLLLSERQGDGFRFNLCRPFPVSRVVGGHTSVGYPLQVGVRGLLRGFRSRWELSLLTHLFLHPLLPITTFGRAAIEKLQCLRAFFFEWVLGLISYISEKWL